MPNIGPLELIIILVIALLILGPGKLPEVGASLGKSIREFRKAASDVQDSVKLDPAPAPAPVAAQTPVAPAVAPAAAPVTPVAAPVAPAVPGANTLTAAAEPNVLAAPVPVPAESAAPLAPEPEPVAPLPDTQA